MPNSNKLIYISQGNIPCKWTHSIQMMLTAEAFGQTVKNFCLLTRGRIQDIAHSSQYIFDYYGIRHPFPIVRLPLTARWNEEDGWKTRYPAFMKLSVLYARLHRQAVIYTRHSAIARMTCGLGLRTILECHAGIEEGFGDQALLKDHPKFLGFVLNSKTIRDQYFSEGVDPKKLLVETNGVNMEFFDVKEEKTILRRRLGLPVPNTIALYSGHLFPFKGVDLIMECAHLLPDVQFVLLGGADEDVRKYRKYAAEELPNVHVLGFIPHAEIAQYLAAADLFLLPNLSSTPISNRTPLKIFEYCAAKRPIIASDIEQFREFLKPDRTAFLFKADDLNAFKTAIERAIDLPDTNRTVTENAYEMAKEHSWLKRAESIISRYAPELLKERGAAYE